MIKATHSGDFLWLRVHIHTYHTIPFHSLHYITFHLHYTQTQHTHTHLIGSYWVITRGSVSCQTGDSSWVEPCPKLKHDSDMPFSHESYCWLSNRHPGTPLLNRFEHVDWLYPSARRENPLSTSIKPLWISINHHESLAMYHKKPPSFGGFPPARNERSEGMMAPPRLRAKSSRWCARSYAPRIPELLGTKHGPTSGKWSYLRVRKISWIRKNMIDFFV